MFIKRYI